MRTFFRFNEQELVIEDTTPTSIQTSDEIQVELKKVFGDKYFSIDPVARFGKIETEENSFIAGVFMGLQSGTVPVRVSVFESLEAYASDTETPDFVVPAFLGYTI